MDRRGFGVAVVNRVQDMRMWARALVISAAILHPAAAEMMTTATAFVSPVHALRHARDHAALAMPKQQMRVGMRVGQHARLQPRCMVQPGTEVKAESGTTTIKATDYYKPLVAGDILESTPTQQAIVGGAYLALAALVVKGCLLLPPMSALVAAQVRACVCGTPRASRG